MGKKRKKLSDVHFDKGKFFSIVSLDSEIVSELAENFVNIEMLRVGDFKHKIYGDLEITEEMLESMVTNFNEEIVGREISFDWNHKAEAASGWLKELKIEEGVLIGTTELTEEGKDSIEKKRYGYFSIEYSDNYEDPESGEEFGPAIMGGALTNRPFISKLKKIEFSLNSDDSDVSVYRLQTKEVNSMKKDIKRDPAVKDEDVTLEDLQAMNEELEKKNDELQKKLDESSDDNNKELQDFILEQKKEMKEMSDKIEKYEEKTKTLHSKQIASDERARVVEIDRICDKLLTDKHHHPAVVSIAKEIMLSDQEEDRIIKFTETIGEGEEEKSVDLELTIREAVLKILEAIPTSQRANYNEETNIGDGVSFTEEEQNKMENEAIGRSFRKKGLRLVEKK